MKQTGLLFTILCLAVSSCSYNQFSAAATGSSLGGMFGSSIGGLIGGYRGHEIGTVAGMTAGAAIGLAATSEKKVPATSAYDEEEEQACVEYEPYRPQTYSRNNISHSGFEALEIERIRFADANNNHYLEPSESASLVMDVYNRGQHTLYNIAPEIRCDNKRIHVSPTAIVSELAPGKGFHYRAEVFATDRLNFGETKFQIYFTDGQQKVLKKTFNIRTKK